MITPKDVIVPGITKKAVSYIPSGKNVEDAVELEEKDNIQPNVTTKWLLELRNDGSIPICDYTMIDSVKSQFHILSKEEATNETLNLGLNKNAFVLTIYDEDDNVLHKYDLSEEVWKLIPDNGPTSFHCIWREKNIRFLQVEKRSLRYIPEI